MKVTHRIPTTQYGFVEVEGTSDIPSIVRAEHDALLAAFAEKPENTLPDKEMGEFLYAQIHGLGNHVETWEKMNPAQQTFVKLLKNALARKKPDTVTNI